MSGYLSERQVFQLLKACPIPNCDRPIRTRGWCHNHYERWRRGTDRHRMESLLRPMRILPSGCVLWTGARNREGYGLIRRGGRTYLAHRVTYEKWVGPLVPGLQIDHLCRVRACVAPAHLEQVTPKTNTQRSMAGMHNRVRAFYITHCPHGHPYDEANTYRSPGRPRHRMCRACMAARQRAAATCKRLEGAAR